MNSVYIVATWRNPAGPTQQRIINSKVKQLDPEMEFVVAFGLPKNAVPSWLQRPDDGANDSADRQVIDRKCIDAAKKVLKADSIAEPEENQDLCEPQDPPREPLLVAGPDNSAADAGGGHGPEPPTRSTMTPLQRDKWDREQLIRGTLNLFKEASQPRRYVIARPRQQGS